ncbi:MAG: hypothetical protein ACF8XB_09020 [Planctomycetota bacterium JB042]
MAALDDVFSSWFANSSVDPEGRYSIPTADEGRFLLEVHAGDFELRAPIVVGEREIELDFALETGGLRGRVPGRDGEDVHLLWRGDGGAWVSLVDHAGPDGTEEYSFARVPAGRVLLQRGDGDVVETTVFAGEELLFDLP